MSSTDPLIERAARSFAHPLPISEVEDLEVAVKRAWYPLVAEGSSDATEAFRFASYFASIGFIRKYKSYGTKFASPFGYSIFSLQPGRGFSIQLHRTAKVEAFHILSVSDDAFVLLATPEEWEREGPAFLRQWEQGSPTDSPMAYRPQPGDKIVIDSLEVVHSIIGCTLEEFATTSNDAVERLHDQNAGAAARVPPSHESLSDVLAPMEDAVPRRHLERDGDGWRTAPLAAGTDEFVALPEGRLSGLHAWVEPEAPLELATSTEEVATVACTAGGVTLELRGGELQLNRGDIAPLAPAEVASAVSSVGGASRIAVCRVASELAFADLR